MMLSIITVIKDDYDGLLKTHKSISGLISSPNIEWVVVDGGNCKETSEFMSSIEGNVNYTKGKDGGIYQAMNKAILKCSGQYAWFLNARDINLMSLSEINEYLSSQRSDLIKFQARVNQNNYVKLERLSILYLIRHTFNHQSYFTKLEKLKEFPFLSSLSLTGDYHQLLNFWIISCDVLYFDKEIVQYDLSGATVGSATNNRIRKERIRSSLLVARNSYSLSVLFIAIIQIFIYSPYLLAEKVFLNRT